MSWPSTALPSDIARMRTHLVASATFVAAFGASDVIATARVHYPAANVTDEDGTPDTMPLALLDRGRRGGRKFAEGAGPLLRGSLSVTLYVPNNSTYKTAAAVEALADAIAVEVMDQDYGLPFNDYFIDKASDPSPQAVAAHADAHPTMFRSIRIDFDYGLSA